MSLNIVLSVVALALLLTTRDAYRLRGRGARPARWWLPGTVAVGLAAFALVGYAEIHQLAPQPIGPRIAVIW